ncbi:uncharacterized protein EDB91DRAFT_1254936 [Suillus paluster]|uniref:uncharacterized protein n=1 Tax=Suillus paluster TaxID=48578 RepID=UPI001B8779F6|nr:uncharacterized protein EDB91DRAFT_1254936 [Suillus paluster]KAG1725075.1 hypothetical protein EDB91DRAFT_1254936 [Suillus paluster]
MTDTAQQFYNLHRRDKKGGSYHHAFVYTPAALVLRNDAGDWIAPYDADIVTSAAVNASFVRRKNGKRVSREETEDLLMTATRTPSSSQYTCIYAGSRRQVDTTPCPQTNSSSSLLPSRDDRPASTLNFAPVTFL